MAMARHRTQVGRGTAAGPIVDSKAEAVAELMLEIAQCFFRIRALGQKTGLITSWGGGAFGFIRSLALLGPLTVPQVHRQSEAPALEACAAHAQRGRALP